MDLAEAVPALVGGHPLVESIELTGSRAGGIIHELSDWDFLVETSDISRLAKDLSQLVEPLRPLAAQWDRYSDYACYMVMLRGPVKFDLIFPSEPHEWEPPWMPSADNLEDIDTHFWDWILWLVQKSSGRDEWTLRKGLRDLQRLMLAPMGGASDPTSIAEALESYLALRAGLEQRFGVRVPRELENEVRPAVLSRVPRRA